MLMGTEVDTVLLDNWPLLLLIAGRSVHCFTMCALHYHMCSAVQFSAVCSAVCNALHSIELCSAVCSVVIARSCFITSWPP